MTHSWWRYVLYFIFFSPPASEYASFQCAICCLIWLPPLQHVCPGAGEIGNKSFACISCLFDPAAHFCLMKLDFNSKCHSQSWQSLLFWSITRVLSEKHSGFSDYLLRGKKSWLVVMCGRDDFGRWRESYLLDAMCINGIVLLIKWKSGH